MYSKNFMKDVIKFVNSLESSIKEFKVEINTFKEKLEDSWEKIKKLEKTIIIKNDKIRKLERENKALKITIISNKAVLRDVLPKLRDLKLRESVKDFNIIPIITDTKEDEKNVFTEPIKKKKKGNEHKHPKKDAYENKIINIYA